MSNALSLSVGTENIGLLAAVGHRELEFCCHRQAPEPPGSSLLCWDTAFDGCSSSADADASRTGYMHGDRVPRQDGMSMEAPSLGSPLSRLTFFRLPPLPP